MLYNAVLICVIFKLRVVMIIIDCFMTLHVTVLRARNENGYRDRIIH